VGLWDARVGMCWHVFAISAISFFVCFKKYTRSVQSIVPMEPAHDVSDHNLHIYTRSWLQRSFLAASKLPARLQAQYRFVFFMDSDPVGTGSWWFSHCTQARQLIIFCCRGDCFIKELCSCTINTSLHTIVCPKSIASPRNLSLVSNTSSTINEPECIHPKKPANFVFQGHRFAGDKNTSANL